MRRNLVVLAFAALLCFAACDSDGDEGYPDQVRENFVTACTEGGAPKDTCECTLEELEKTVPFDEYVELEVEGEQALLDDGRIQAAAEACR